MCGWRDERGRSAGEAIRRGAEDVGIRVRLNRGKIRIMDRRAK